MKIKNIKLKKKKKRGNAYVYLYKLPFLGSTYGTTLVN